MLKKTLALAILSVLALSFAFVPAPLTLAQNISSGRWPSDSGPGVYGYGSATDTTAQTMAAAPGAGNSNYIYWVLCVNTSASTVNAGLIKGGTTSIAVVSCPAASAVSHPYYFNPPIRAGNNVAVTIEATASATTTYFTMSSRISRF